MKVKSLKQNEIGLIRQRSNGVYQQIALTEEQSNELHNFLSFLSQNQPFMGADEKYDLIFKQGFINYRHILENK